MAAFVSSLSVASPRSAFSGRHVSASRPVTLSTSSSVAPHRRQSPPLHALSMSLSPNHRSFRRSLITPTADNDSISIATAIPLSKPSSSSSLPLSNSLSSSTLNIPATVSATLRVATSKLVVSPARSLFAATLLLARRLQSLRSRKPVLYRGARMALGLSLGLGMMLINRYSGLSTPPTPRSLATVTAPTLSIPAAISGSIPPYLAAVLRPFTEAFGVVFLSEFGDKSMFATALMAMKHSPFIVCIGALGALTVMTFIACFLGQLMQFLPTTLTHYSSIALFVFFGIQMILQSRTMRDDTGERKDAEEMVQKNGAQDSSSPLAVLAKVSSLIFVAEWCDRSMLATMALAASSNTLAVIGGATFANIVCTGMAVCAATLVASKISERMVALIAGILFEVFAVFTYLEGPEQQQ